MYAPAETAIRGGDDILAADGFGEADDPVGNELWIFDQVGRVSDDPGQDFLAGRQLNVLPDLPLVLVAGVSGLERVIVAVHRQHEVHQVLHRDVGGVRAVPASPAQVETDFIRRQSFDRVIERVDLHFGVTPVAFDARLVLLLIPIFADGRIVKLNGQAGVDDRLVLFVHGVGAGVQQLLFGLVILVRHARAACRSDRVHPRAFRGQAGRLQPGLEIGDVALDHLLALIFDRAFDQRTVLGHELHRQSAAGLRIEIGIHEFGHVAALAPVADDEVFWRHGRLGVRRKFGEPEALVDHLNAGEPRDDVRPPGTVIVRPAYGVAEFAVIDEIDAGVLLLLNDFGHGILKLAI